MSWDIGIWDESVWQKEENVVWQWFKKLWELIKQFFQRLFGRK